MCFLKQILWLTSSGPSYYFSFHGFECRNKVLCKVIDPVL